MAVPGPSTASDQAFLFDHLVGEAREEIKYHSSRERSDPDKIIEVLQELYGCVESYVALQEVFFSRQQQEGETLLEFSLALMGLMTSASQSKRAIPSCSGAGKLAQLRAPGV